ncbi:MAG: BatA and WFA domain-containing protein [Polyangiaceae bacterium]
MSFVAIFALAIGVLVGFPIVAHLLRRAAADEREFPAARLVPGAEPTHRRRHRLEDRALLGVRAVLILALAVLGATPLVQCSRLALERDAGASIALALVVDDSHSMRARLSGGDQRWQAAIAGALELLDAARTGDAIAVVLAGKPARLLLPATTDLNQARQVLTELQVSDRGTDLDAAVKLGEASLQALPHKDRRIVLLSDLAAPALDVEKLPLTAPLERLSQPAADCGIVQALRSGNRASVRVACNAASAAAKRTLRVQLEGDLGPSEAGPAVKAGAELGTAPLVDRGGVQDIAIELSAASGTMSARLSEGDALPENDRAPLSLESGRLGVAVVRDPSTTSVATGGAPIIEQALASLERDVGVRPLQVLPDKLTELDGYALTIVDDPPGVPAEARSALTTWLERGRVAMLLLGPNADAAPLGSTFEPFARGALRWQSKTGGGADPTSLGFLGEAASSLEKLEPRGRGLLAPALTDGAEAMGKWEDGEPFAVSTKVGRGLALTMSLPASLEQSDFALRPGFLALLTHALDAAERRAGPRRSLAGDTWGFPARSTVEILGPDAKPLSLVRGDDGDDQTLVVAQAGRYRVSIDGDVAERFVSYPEDELVRLPSPLASRAGSNVGVAVRSKVDASKHLALVCLALFAVEVLLRLYRLLSRKSAARDLQKSS